MAAIGVVTAISHVASQLLGRWLPPPNHQEVGDLARICHLDELSHSQGLSGLMYDDWFKILEAEASSFFPVLPWLTHWTRKGQLSLSKVAQAAENHFKENKKVGASYVGYYDWNYPELLRHIARPPLGLSVLGKEDLLSLNALAVIGSRRTSYRALQTCVDVGVECVRQGLVVVSGGAIGCDIAVHEGMLACSSDEIGAVIVQASGLMNLFPKSNGRTFYDLLDRGGAIASERLCFQEARPHDFPSRNRIVSGMSSVTVVMAAAARSGSLITAREALEQGRDVYVFDGQQDDVRFDGSAQLIADGATPFFSAAELLQKLSLDYRCLWASKKQSPSSYCQYIGDVDTFKGESK